MKTCGWTIVLSPRQREIWLNTVNAQIGELEEVTRNGDELTEQGKADLKELRDLKNQLS